MLKYSVNFTSRKSDGRQVRLADSFMQKRQTSDLISEFPLWIAFHPSTQEQTHTHSEAHSAKLLPIN